MGKTDAMLTDGQSIFRSLKSELGLRPIYHHKEHWADGHLFISVIADQAIQVLRTPMAPQDLTASGTTIRHALRTLPRITTAFAGPDGRRVPIRNTALPNADQAAIYHAMQITPPARNLRRVIV